MSAAGDLRTVLSLDDLEFIAGMKQSEKALDGLGAHAEHAGHSLHRSLHRGAHLAGNFAFMMSEGKGVDDMKGKMEQLAMMAPMVGMALGGWAGPIGVAAGVLGASLIPKIFEAREGFEGMAESIKKSEEAMNALIKRTNDMIEFRAKLAGMNERGEFAKDKGELDKAANMKRAEGQILKDQLKALQDQQKKLADAKAADLNEGGMMANLKFVGNKFANFGAVALTGKMIEDPTEKLIQDQIDKLTARMKELNAEQRDIGEKKGELKAEQAGLEEHGLINPKEAIERSKKLLELEEKRQQIAERIGKEIESPYEKAQSRIRELNQAFQEGIIEKEDLQKGSMKAIEDYRKSIENSGKNEGAIAGSAQSYKQIRESVNSQNRVDDEKIKLLRQQAEEAQKSRVALEDIEKNLKVTLEEGIA